MRNVLAVCLVAVIAIGCTSSGSPSSPARPSITPATSSLATAPPSSPSGATSPPAVIPEACGDAPIAWVTGHDVFQVPDLPEPAPRIPYRDPVFGTCIVRVTDRTADVEPDDDSKGLKNEYSRVQAFNADGSRILVRGLAGPWYLYDAVTRGPLGRLPIDGIDPRWDAADPATLYYSDGGTRLMAYTVGGEPTVVHDFGADLPGYEPSAVWMRYEGSPSRDTRYWALMAEDRDWLASALLVYDREADRVIATRDLRDLPPGAREIDSVTISPMGTYVLAPFDNECAPGAPGSDAEPCGLMVYDRELVEGRGLLPIVGHSDLAIDAEGREVLVYQDINNDTISMLDLGDGEVTELTRIDFKTDMGLHFSGRSLDAPGWAVVATVDGDPGSYTWMEDQVFLLELRAGGRIVRLAHTHSLVDPDMEQDYWAEPQATTNLDLTRILFTSNWGRSGTEGVDMYEIDLPGDWAATLP